MSDLDNIKSRFGQKPPFSAPENYFSEFSESLMAQLPEKNSTEPLKVSMWKRIKPIIYLAAMFTAAIWTVNLMLVKHAKPTTHSSITSLEQDADAVSIEMSVDDYSLYEYMNSSKETN